MTKIYSQDQNSEDASRNRPAQGHITIEPLESSEKLPLEKIIRISDQLISGGEPKTPQAFTALKKLGVKTIISVDGARPKVDLANANGIRYVHIPIGYDGIKEDEIDKLFAASRQCDGPIFVHCHHGQHRAPAAATILAKGLGLEFTRPDQTDILVAADTGVQYDGLWKCAAQAQVPESLSTDTELPEIVRADSDVDAMSHMDRTYENLKSLSANDWEPLPTHPDITAAHEALQLWEQLVEWKRHDEHVRTEGFDKLTDESIVFAAELKDLLKSGDKQTAHERLAALKSSCSACHKEFRN